MTISSRLIRMILVEYFCMFGKLSCPSVFSSTMSNLSIKPRKALNKAYLKVKPSREHINTFKENLSNLLKKVSPNESEEFNKNLLSRFLRDTYYYPDYFIN